MAGDSVWNVVYNSTGSCSPFKGYRWESADCGYCDSGSAGWDSNPHP